MTWIKTIAYEEADANLLKLYERVKGPDNNIDNIMLAHSLRPHTLNGHMTLYKNVLHHARNSVDRWLLEMLGVYTSLLNQCSYCVEHHFSGMCNILQDETRAKNIREALETAEWEDLFEPKIKMALNYAGKLTRAAATVSESDVIALRTAGWEDGEILEINQVVAYFKLCESLRTRAGCE